MYFFYCASRCGYLAVNLKTGDGPNRRFSCFSTQSNDQSKRYSALGSQCRQLAPGTDLVAFARSLTPLPTTPQPSQRVRNYCPPQAPADTEGMVLDPVVTVSAQIFKRSARHSESVVFEPK